jgi:hypothetical protein
VTIYQSGRARVSPQAPADPGVEGNTRLTSVTGVLLIGLLAVEGLTILSINGLITLHIFIGIVLLGPILLKTASTVYRSPATTPVARRTCRRDHRTSSCGCSGRWSSC